MTQLAREKRLSRRTYDSNSGLMSKETLLAKVVGVLPPTKNFNKVGHIHDRSQY